MQFTDSWDSAEVEIVDGLSKMALDVIGLAGEHQLRISTPVVSNIHIVQCCLRHFAGFDYDFHSLNTDGPPNKLKVALDTLFSGAERANTLLRGLRLLFPGLQSIVGCVYRKASQS